MNSETSKIIDDYLVEHPPVYDEAGYYDKMSKQLGVSKESIRKRCRKLGLTHIKINSQVTGGEKPSPKVTQEDIKNAMLPPIKLEFKDIGDTSTFMDVSTRMGNCWLTINTGSVFYRNLYSKIEDKDEDVKRAFNLILMAFARAEDEAYSNSNLFEAFKDVRELWGRKLRKYLNTDFQA